MMVAAARGALWVVLAAKVVGLVMVVMVMEMVVAKGVAIVAAVASATAVASRAATMVVVALVALTYLHRCELCLLSLKLRGLSEARKEARKEATGGAARAARVEARGGEPRAAAAREEAKAGARAAEVWEMVVAVMAVWPALRKWKTLLFVLTYQWSIEESRQLP